MGNHPRSRQITGEEMEKWLTDNHIEEDLCEKAMSGEYTVWSNGSIRNSQGHFIKGITKPTNHSLKLRLAADNLKEFYRLAAPEFKKACDGLFSDLHHPDPKIRHDARKIFFGYLIGSPTARPVLPQETDLYLPDSSDNGDGAMNKVLGRLSEISSRLTPGGEMVTIDRRDDDVIEGESTPVETEPRVIKMSEKARLQEEQKRAAAARKRNFGQRSTLG